MIIRHKLILASCSSVVMVAFVGAVSLFQLCRIARPLNEDLPQGIGQISRTSHLDGLAQFIRYYDEVLTQSARNYAFTKEKKWEQRYRDVEPKLDQMIRQAIVKGDNEDVLFFSTVDKANLVLVEMECRSIELVDNGQAQEAVKILESDEYWRQKEIYAKGLVDYVHRRGAKYDDALEISTQTMQSLTSRTQKVISVYRLSILISVVAALILSTSVGLYMFRDIGRRLERLSNSAVEIGKGKLDTLVAVESDDELGDLSRSINAMVSNLKEVVASRDLLNQEVAIRLQTEEKLELAHTELQRRIAELGQAQEAALNIMEDAKEAEEKLKRIAEEWITTFDSITDLVSIHDKDFKIVRANKSFINTFNLKPREIIGKTCHELIHGTKEPPPFCPHRQTFDTGKAIRKESFEPHLGIHVEVSTSPLFDENGQVVASVHIAKDITGRKQVEEEIRGIAKFPSENPNPVLRIQKDGKILYGNDAALPLLARWKSKVGGVVPAKWRRLVDLSFESEKAISSEEEVDDSIFSFVVAPVADNLYANMYASNVTERKQAEVELKAAQEKLIETAHRAGMAEVAADVLHNVGNVLNSINVSTTVIRKKVTNSELANLEKVAGIINEHTDDLGTFLTEDPQGRHIPVYLTEVSRCLTDEQTDIIDKLKVLANNVQHIKDIVSTQQLYAKVSGVEVQTSVSKLAEDAIQINTAGLERNGTRLIREFEELGDVEIDKQKVLQILVNLINNAKYALSSSNKEEKLMTIRIYKHGEARFRIEVADNGVGISEDNLTKIFSHGFTTKKHGHGFGLHSSALAAKEMAGSLAVHSDGLGQGATFTLELPFKPMEIIE